MTAATVDNVQRLYRSLINGSPTLESLPRMFSLQQYPSGDSVIMHLAFAAAALVVSMYELGAGSNPGLARSATADGPVLIRRAQCCGLAERIFLCFYLVGHHKPAGRAAMTFPELTLRFAGGGCAGGPWLLL